MVPLFGMGVAVFLGKMEKADAMIKALRYEHKISKYVLLSLEACANAGMGSVESTRNAGPST